MNNQIFDLLFELVNFFNDPKNDNILLKNLKIKESPNLMPIIMRIGKMGKTTVGQLARQLGKNHSSMSRQIDKFENAGLLISRESQEDMRVREISLSKTGQKIYQQILEEREKALNKAFANLEDDQLEQIKLSLELLVDSVNTAREE
ncbi:MarR family winged helix-turn-helix transcriptional regulator [Floricoccus penangensis]|uniref:MarR family winged helix-turn-helix transcriptional regulator n=1 Tax=Floricoccus penangensis TaxID=1859475 RepID=UPI00203C088D|nr:MarR family transcriptional regulator [Floricoccus penangensis]URZ88099.1 MarR family transcriptional regulator [Floricoccus penangensis]